MVRTRFAPSPTGYMHIGNLRTALFEYLLAKHFDGQFILRIEDTDQAREVEGADQMIYDTLKQAGLFWDEGPDVGGEFGPYIQSERLSMYKDYALELIDKGAAHYCFCSQEEIEEAKEQAARDGLPFIFEDPCKSLSKEEIEERLQNGESYVIRQTIDKNASPDFDDVVYGHIEADPNLLDESILIKSDGYPTYNFANVIDDHTMGITHVIRGNEYLSSTPKYNLLYDAYGWQRPIYVHVPPVMKDETHKLSKRNGDASYQDLVSQGYLPEAIINYLALLGWSPQGEKEIYSLPELIEEFDVSRISRAPAIFDLDKLTWLNGQYLRALPLEQFLELINPSLDFLPSHLDRGQIAAILQPRVEKLSDIPEMLDFLVELGEYEPSLYTHKKMKTTPESSLTSLQAVKTLLEGIEEEEWQQQLLHDRLLALVKELGLKNGQVLYPLRVALSGKAFTPGGAIELASILGKEESLARIDRALELLNG